jgi:glycogen debranching enzyme
MIFLLNALRLGGADRFRTWVEQACVDILGALMTYQGTREYDITDEQPGKIIHEYRETIDSRLLLKGLQFDKHVSFSGFDQTFLFIIAYRLFADNFPNHPAVLTFWPAVERALTWIEFWADDDKDGLFEYQRRDERNILHQVWRDSFDSLAQTGINTPPHPIAWLSVQAYGFRALDDAADLYQRRGNPKKATIFASRAANLRDIVNRSFWLADEECFAIALDQTKTPVRMVNSDGGHALWSGIITDDLKPLIVDRLSQPDMFTSCGLRTLSSQSEFYAPFSFHRGNIWPFDNGIFLLGLMAEGYHGQARRVIEAVCSTMIKMGSPVEMYVVLDPALLVEPQLNVSSLLFRRRPTHENLNQGFSAAAAVLMATALARLEGIELDDKE